MQGFAWRMASSTTALVLGAGISGAGVSIATPSTGTVTIATPVTQATVNAPAQVWLEVASISGMDVTESSGVDPTYREVTYVWTLRGSPLSDWTAPQSLTTEHNNPNVMYGKRVCFLIPDARTCDFDLWCVDSSGTTATATAQVVVAAASYSSANTIVFASDGVWTGAPTHDVANRCTTRAQVETAVQANTSPHRLSFKPGEEIDDWYLSIGAGNLEMVDTWTAGSTTQLNLTNDGSNDGFAFSDSYPGDQFTIRDIVMDGGWDATTETGYAAGVTNIMFPGIATITRDFRMTHYNCTYQGQSYLNITMRDNASVTGNRMVLANCSVKGWRSYGAAMFPNTTAGPCEIALLGNEFNQGANALSGYSAKIDMTNDHGSLRIQTANAAIISQTRFFTMGGWSGFPQSNANVRLHTSVNTDAYTVFERNQVENGYIGVKIDGQKPGQAEYPGNHIIFNNLFIGTCRSNVLGVRFQYGGTSIFNNILYDPDNRAFEDAAKEFFYTDGGDNAQGGNSGEAVYNGFNSMISRASTFTRTDVNNGGGWTDYTEEHNIYYHPGRTTDGPLEFTTAMGGVTPAFTGIQWGFGVVTSETNISNGSSAVFAYSNWNNGIDYWTDSLATGTTFDDGDTGTSPTQTDWQGYGDTNHMIRIGGSSDVQHSARGDFSVAFEAGGIRITNNSGTDWTDTLTIKLDRNSNLDTELPRDTAFANPTTIPTCQPDSGSGADGVTTSGWVPYYDFYFNVRSASHTAGAVQAATS